MAESKVLTFRAGDGDLRNIEAIIRSGLANSQTEAIRLALQLAPSGMVERLERDIEERASALRELKRSYAIEDGEAASNDDPSRFASETNENPLKDNKPNLSWREMPLRKVESKEHEGGKRANGDYWLQTLECGHTINGGRERERFRRCPECARAKTSPFRSYVRDDQVDELIAIFEREFQPPRIARFGSVPLGKLGASDGSDGVQWNCWIELERREAWLGVNLEGLKFGARNFPVANFVANELTEPQLFDIIGELSEPERVILRWTRDAWQGGGRLPSFKEHEFAYVRLSELTRDQWLAQLKEAVQCLEERRGRRSRAVQKVTLLNGRRVDREVSPHLQFRTSLHTVDRPAQDQLIEAMRAARMLLQPLHTFIASRVEPGLNASRPLYNRAGQ